MKPEEHKLWAMAGEALQLGMPPEDVADSIVAALAKRQARACGCRTTARCGSNPNPLGVSRWSHVARHI